MTSINDIERGARGPAMRGPAIAASLALAALLGAVALAFALPLGSGHSTIEVRLAARSAHEIRHAGGTIARVHVMPGAAVAAGDLLATVDAAEIDAGIATLKTRLGTARHRLDAVQREAQAFNVLHEQRLISRARVTDLEAQVSALENEVSEALAQIVTAEQKLAEIEIRTPVAGIFQPGAGLSSGSPIGTGQTIAEIATDPTRPVLSGELTRSQRREARIGSAVGVMIVETATGKSRRTSARLTWVATRPSPGGSTFAAAFELEPLPADVAASLSPAERLWLRVVLPRHDLTVARQLLEPLRRAVTSLSNFTSPSGA